MIKKHFKWKVLFLTSLSMSLSCAHASEFEKKGRLLTRSEAINNLRKKASNQKTEEHIGEGKTIDYTLYNYGGNAVLSLTKDKGTGLGFNDTQASTIAALGNAALILGGALLFGQFHNRAQARAQENLYARGFASHPLPAPPPLPLRKRRLRKRFRKRRLPLFLRNDGAYSQRNGRFPVGGRRRLRKNFLTRRRPQAALESSLRGGYLGNHRMENELKIRPKLRDSVMPIRDETYSSEASVLDPIKPMLYDPYMYEDQPMMQDYYYDDYYDPAEFKEDQVKINKVKTQPQPALIPKKLSPPESSPDLFFESRTPSRNELLLKMSEEKRREKLQKERAKLLEATLMTPTEMQQEPEAIPEVVMKKQPDPSPVRTRTRIPIRQRQRRPLPGLQENIGNSNMPAFSSPRAAFQTKFPPPSPGVDSPREDVEDPFTFGQSVDPFQDIASEFSKPWPTRGRRLSKPRRMKRIRFRDFDYY